MRSWRRPMREPPGERKRNYQEVEHATGDHAPEASRQGLRPRRDQRISCRFGFVQHIGGYTMRTQRAWKLKQKVRSPSGTLAMLAMMVSPSRTQRWLTVGSRYVTSRPIE